MDLVRVRDAGTFAEALPTGTSAVISRAPMMARTATTVGVALPLLLSLSHFSSLVDVGMAKTSMPVPIVWFAH